MRLRRNRANRRDMNSIAHWQKSRWTFLLLTISLGFCGASARADQAATIRQMHDLVKPSLVAVKYTWASELGSQELTAAGVIVSDDGLVAFPIEIVSPTLLPS